MCANIEVLIDAACCPVPKTRTAPQPASSTVLLDGPAQHKRGVTARTAVRMPRARDNQRGRGNSTRRVLGAPDERTARHARIALAATAPVAPAAMRAALGMSSTSRTESLSKATSIFFFRKEKEKTHIIHVQTCDRGGQPLNAPRCTRPRAAPAPPVATAPRSIAVR